MRAYRWWAAATLAASALLLAGAAAAQESSETSNDTVLLQAEVKMLKALFAKHQEQLGALQKQIAELSAQMQQLQAQVAAASQARAAAQPATPPATPGATPVEPPFPTPTPARSDNFATVSDLLNAFPPQLLGAGELQPLERQRLSRQADAQSVGKSVSAEIVATAAEDEGRGGLRVTGNTAPVRAAGGMTACTIVGFFDASQKAALGEVTRGRKISMTGRIASVSITSARSRPGAGPEVFIHLTDCRSGPPAGGEAALPRPVPSEAPSPQPAEKPLTIQALIGSIPKESLSSPTDTPEQAKAKDAQLEAWIRQQLVGKMLQDEATIQGFAIMGGGIVQARLYYGPPQEQSEYMCQFDATFPAGQADAVIRTGKGKKGQFQGTIAGARIFAAVRFPRIEIQLKDCKLESGQDQGQEDRGRPPTADWPRIQEPPIGPGGRRP